MPNDEAESLVRLFIQEVPEIAAGVVEIRAIARRVGVRSKLALYSHDHQVDDVGVCVGIRGSRIKNIVDQLGGERIDLFGWDDSPEKLIRNALQPAAIEKVILHHAEHRATVVVREDPWFLALGLGDLHRELASELSGWEIEVVLK